MVAKPKLEEEKWYTAAQAGARFLMMLRNVSVSYRNTYNLALPGFLPQVGDMLGQRRLGGAFTPGVDFGFGLVGDSYIDKAKERGWLLMADSVSTPATTATTEDVQVKATLEPFSDLKIDVNLSRNMNRTKSIQYMYTGNPTTQTGNFTMTTISIKSAFGSRGNASNGYRSKAFDRFRSYLPVVQKRVEAQYMGLEYPAGVGHTGTFDPAKGTVDTYSSDVMIPAFLAAYTGGNVNKKSLDVFPSLLRMLPNWAVSYKGLSTLPWVRDHFKSVAVTHGYKSVYNVGAFNTYSSWVEAFAGSPLGFMENTITDSYQPSSMYNISTVSINESFTPLAGLKLTFMNNMTLNLEYRTTRAITLSMTSAQVNETSSKDMVVGWGYKIADFKFSSLWGGARKSASAKASKSSHKRTPNSSRSSADKENKNTQTAKSATRGGIAHALNLSFNFSFRNQDALRRDIQTGLSEATGGNRAVKTSFQASYDMSRYVTMSLYYDRQRNNPLLSSSSYPTITQDFGFTMAFKLTR